MRNRILLMISCSIVVALAACLHKPQNTELEAQLRAVSPGELRRLGRPALVARDFDRLVAEPGAVLDRVSDAEVLHGVEAKAERQAKFFVCEVRKLGA